MLDINIRDSSNKNAATVSDDGFLRAEIRDYYNWENNVIFFTNDTFGSDITINATSNGIPENIHNGLDAIYWTGVNIVGDKATFNSTDQANTGTRSIKWDGDNNNDVFELRYPTGTFEVSGYTSLDGYLYLDDLDNPNSSEILLYGWNSNTATQVGVQIDLLDYVNRTSLDTWQSFSIPIIDLQLINENITAIRFDVNEVGKIKFYLDDMLFAAPGTAVGTQVYSIQSERGKIIEVDSISFNIVAPVDSTLADATVPKMEYNSLLGTGLANGLLYRRNQNSNVRSSWIIQNFFDLIQRPNATLEAIYGNDTTKGIKVKWNFIENHVLRYGSRDNLTITVSDNLSTYLKLNIIAATRKRDE